MKRFTSIILGVVFFFAFFAETNGQGFVMTIDSPASVAGDYNPYPGSFGGYFPKCDNMSAPMIIAVDEGGATTGCNDIETDLTGKVAIIDRGECQFGTKALHAQTAGAIGVIICNNHPNEGAVGMAGGNDGASVTIPAAMLSKEDCDHIKMGIPDLHVTFEYRLAEPYSDEDNVLWGNEPGQGDFDGGMNGWIAENRAEGVPCDHTYWAWDSIGDAREGTYASGNSVSLAPTSCNGVMEFNSDYWDNQGCTGDVRQIGALISPTIDLSGTDVEGVSLKFFNSAQQFDSYYYITYSNDNGETWPDTIRINKDLRTYQRVDDVRIVPLPNCAGASEVKVQFLMAGYYYYWMIDDVQIIEQDLYEMTIDPLWYAIPKNYATPISQVEEVEFMANIANRGARGNTNVNLNMTIKKGEDVVFTADNFYGEVAANDIVKNDVFDDNFMPTEVGNYSGKYKITADSSALDVNPANDEINFTFEVTDDIFAKENGTTYGYEPPSTKWTNGESRTWATGNLFYIPNNCYANSIGFGITNANGTGVQGGDIEVSIYEWDGNLTAAGKITSEHRTKIGWGYYGTISGSEGSTDILFSDGIEDDEGDDLLLQGDKYYLVMVQFNALDATHTARFAMNGALDYGATSKVLGEDGTIPFHRVYVASSDIETKDFSTVYSERYSTPVVRLKINPIVGVNDILSDNDKINVTPNPATNLVYVNVDLANKVENAKIRIADVTGKLVALRDVTRVKTNSFGFDTSDFASGIYFATFTSSQGSKTVRFVINR